MIRIILCILLSVTAAHADSVTVVISSSPQEVTAPLPESATIVPPAVDPVLDSAIKGMVMTHVEQLYDNDINECPGLAIYSAAKWDFNMQMRLGDLPQPFGPEGWPTAQLRTARSPGGTVVHAFTTVVDDPVLAKWSYHLTPAETTALGIRNLILEISFPDAPGGGYQVHNKIPITVRAHVTE